jgi:hypothetical protein
MKTKSIVATINGDDDSNIKGRSFKPVKAYILE